MATSEKLCPRCGERPVKYRSYCQPCTYEYNRNWKRANPEKTAAYAKTTRHRRSEALREYKKAWRKVNADRVKASQQRYREKHGEAMQQRRFELRVEVLSYYSGGTPSCACCGECTIEFLAIDHINGGGAADRRAGRSSGNLYRRLKNQGFPNCFRVLCHNCNSALGFYGYCPHTALQIAGQRENEDDQENQADGTEPEEARRCPDGESTNEGQHEQNQQYG